MPKQKVIEIYLDRTFEEKKVEFDRNKLKPRKKDEVFFEPASVFTERKHGFLSKLKGSRNLVFYVNGALNALKFAEKTDAMEPFWTKKEAKEFVDKETAKSLTKFKPLTIWEFIIILAILIIILIVSIKCALSIGAF